MVNLEGRLLGKKCELEEQDPHSYILVRQLAIWQRYLEVLSMQTIEHIYKGLIEVDCLAAEHLHFLGY
jgi:hypothetical protein